VQQQGRFHIESIADHPELIETIARWHWQEWGQHDPNGSLESWTEGLRGRSQRDRIPTTYVGLGERGRLLGSVTLVERDMSSHPELTPWLAGLYVDPRFRGWGIGAKLTRHASEAAAKMGVTRLYLYTRGARGLYEKLGWQPLFDEPYEGRDVTVMALDLGPSGRERPAAAT
jgi:GNAT superfamily N-acetyltransferase